MGESTRPLSLRRYPDLYEASRALGERLAEVARTAVERQGFFALALSGGTTPRSLYDLLATEFQTRVPWNKTEYFWADERIVPPGDRESNYRLARETVFFRVGVPASRIHRIPAETAPPSRAAEIYEDELKTFFSGRGRAPGRTFDLVLLGMGSDGHTASLFPGSEDLGETEGLVRAATAPPGIEPAGRITLTLPALNGSDFAFFLVMSRGKEDALARIAGERNPGPASLPAARVRAREETVWFIAEGP